MLLQLVSLFAAITQVLFVHPPTQDTVAVRSQRNGEFPREDKNGRHPTLMGGGIHPPVVGSQFSVLSSQFSGAPEFSAESVFLIDTAQGVVMHEKNPDREVPIASITKLMTALVILDHHPNFDRQIAFEQKDARRGDITQLIAQEIVTVSDAWKLMLIGSSNDATALLARTIAGSEERFVAEMNAKAKQLGLSRTHFTDPTGLDPGNVSTAREVAAFARRALAAREIQETVVIPKFTFAPKGKPARTVYSTDQLLRWFRLGAVRSFGGKTGHIEESGYNLVFASGTNSHELIGVVLGSESNDTRFSEMSKLLSWGFEQVKIKN